MPPCVFISHASQDVEVAQRAANYLKEQGIEVRLDAEELGPGANFAAFMESALSMSDYCFLLWSAAARASQFVADEWQNAWSKGIVEKRAFLVVGRLEDIPVPALLGNRVWVNLFPDLHPGLTRVVDEWRADRQAAVTSGRQVGSTVEIAAPGGVRVYITSELYGFTHPARAQLDEPAGVLLDRTLQALGLAKELRDPNGRIGLILEYSLQLDGRALARNRSLRSQGALEDAVFQLVVNARISAATAPQGGAAQPVQFLGVPKQGAAKPTSRLVALDESQRQRLLEQSTAFAKPPERDQAHVD